MRASLTRELKISRGVQCSLSGVLQYFAGRVDPLHKDSGVWVVQVLVRVKFSGLHDVGPPEEGIRSMERCLMGPNEVVGIVSIIRTLQMNTAHIREELNTNDIMPRVTIQTYEHATRS